MTGKQDSKKAISRRTLLAGGAAGAAVSCGGGAGSGPAVHTTQRVRWRLASSFQSNLDTIYGGAEVLAERVEAMTDGNFRIEVYEGGELVPALQVLDAVQQGSVQVGQTAGYYYVGKNPALAFDTCLPFGLNARQQEAWLLEGGGLELVRGVYADFGMISFPGGNTGTQMGGWYNREITGLDSLKGLKMRIPGLGAEVMDQLGVLVQNLPGGEIYPALESGTIDATEWVGPYDDEKLGFWKVARFYYYPGWWEPGPALSYLVNQEAWDKLPATYKAVFQAAAREAGSAMQTRYDVKNPPAFARLREKDITIAAFPESVMQGAAEVAAQQLSDSAAADPVFAKIRDSWSPYRSQTFDWFSTAELSYASFAFPRI